MVLTLFKGLVGSRKSELSGTSDGGAAARAENRRVLCLDVSDVKKKPNGSETPKRSLEASDSASAAFAPPPYG